MVDKAIYPLFSTSFASVSDPKSSSKGWRGWHQVFREGAEKAYSKAPRLRVIQIYFQYPGYPLYGPLGLWENHRETIGKWWFFMGFHGISWDLSSGQLT